MNTSRFTVILMSLCTLLMACTQDDTTADIAITRIDQGEVIASAQNTSRMKAPGESYEFEGTWLWVLSQGGFGGDMITPESIGFILSLEIDHETYRMFVDGQLNKQYPYSVVNAADHFGNNHRYIDLEGSIRYRVKTYADTLELTDGTFDGLTHFYVRN